MPPTTEAEPLLTAAEVAGIARVGRQTVARWAKAGVLPTAATTPGGHRRFRRSDVEALLEPTNGQRAS